MVADKDTSLIEVSAAASDPNLAAQAANALLTNYISQSADQSVAGQAQTYDFLRQNKNASHAKLLAAENALNDFQKRNKIVSLPQNQSDQISRVTGLKSELQSEQSALLVAQARLDADRAALASQPPTLPVVTQGTNPALISLQNQIDNLQVQYQAVTQPGTGFNPKAKNPAPQLRNLRAQIAELKKQKDAAPALLSTQSGIVNPVYQSLKGAVVDLLAQIRAAQAAVAQTQKNLAAAQAGADRFPDYALALSRLTRDHDEALAADQRFGAQLSDLSLREKSRHASAHIIEPALPARGPVRPNKPLNIGFAALIGLFLGICISLLQEFLDDRINTVEDADRLLNLPSLGKVPTLAAANARLLPQMAAADAASESYRVLRTNIHFSSIDTPLKTLLVTSSGPGEGKTTTAVNLAFAMVMDGKRVILVDTDLRRPAVHKMLGLPAQPRPDRRSPRRGPIGRRAHAALRPARPDGPAVRHAAPQPQRDARLPCLPRPAGRVGRAGRPADSGQPARAGCRRRPDFSVAGRRHGAGRGNRRNQEKRGPPDAGPAAPRPRQRAGHRVQ